MSDTPQRDGLAVDPGRDPDRNPFDTDTGLYGQEYHQDREAAMGRQAPSGTVAAHPGEAGPDNADLPPDNGRRASFDPATGAVHGSGSGAGGGNPGEDFDSDPATGDGYPITGSEGIGKRAPTDLGPPHFKE